MRAHGMTARLALTSMLAAAAALFLTGTAASADRTAKVTATFTSPKLYKTHAAVTYDASSVPRGGRVQVVEKPQDKGGDAGNVTLETLEVAGLAPNRRFDAYVYTRRCGATPAAAGRRTQDARTSDHHSQNEVWLNFKTDGRGNGASHSGQYWRFGEGQASQANSVVIISHATKAPVACVTVPFS